MSNIGVGASHVSTVTSQALIRTWVWLSEPDIGSANLLFVVANGSPIMQLIICVLPHRDVLQKLMYI